MNHWKPILAAALIAVSLSGCAGFDAAWSGANNYYSGELNKTVKNIQGVNDNAAKTWADAGCATPYGELVRNGSGNPNLPAAIIALCGAPSGFTTIHSAAQATATTSVPTTIVTVPTPAAPPAQ
jgi:outer membrane lipoprotein SlyB